MRRIWLKEGDLAKAAKIYKTETGVACNAFHPEVPLDLARESRKKVVEFLEKVEQCRKWPQQACTTMFFLIPKDVTYERPIALVPTMIRRCEASRAPEVAKWQYKYRIGWDATDGRKGGAQRTVWEILLVMERFKYQTGEKDQSLGLGFGGSFRVCQSPSGMGLGDAFQLSQKEFAGAGTSSTSGVFSSKGAWRSRSRPLRPFSHEVELLASAHCVAGRTEWSYTILSASKIEGFFGRHHSFLEWEEQGVGGVGGQSLEKIPKEVEEKGLKLSITERVKESKSKQSDRFLQISGREGAGMQQNRRSGYGQRVL